MGEILALSPADAEEEIERLSAEVDQSGDRARTIILEIPPLELSLLGLYRRLVVNNSNARDTSRKPTFYRDQSYLTQCDIAARTINRIWRETPYLLMLSGGEPGSGPPVQLQRLVQEPHETYPVLTSLDPTNPFFITGTDASRQNVGRGHEWMPIMNVGQALHQGGRLELVDKDTISPI